ncbi:CGNR zinc finger domain-containing protein [Pseudonocardia cypriaca]|uniref:Putative RNA-binding Zn ribbon-like protein n=1 Tax=Pseudonocardia cypriaca TaxID=882449 RepID=A0A543FMU7_9PSEU|nr:CGNR zinc finger domain-containing protein [Pseudonocardia cypriaca]TQM35197.1 putative RNA-binding Zn ribbon-like protein [Pseudonocardia cypriaca]
MPLPAWVAPDETKPAPMPLLLVQAFVNTFEADSDTDLLREPDSARHWLTAAGLADAATVLGYEELRVAREVRESVRAVLAANAGGPPPGAAVLAPLRAAARASTPLFEIDPIGRVHIEPSPRSGSEIAWTGLLIVIRDAQADGTWQRLKACENHECGWAFYDRSHGRRGRWCEMSGCGNRVKNRNLRARRRA